MAKHFPTVSDSTFEQEVLRSEQPVLVDFWAEWCGPCKLVAPTLEALARDYSGRLRVLKSNVDENATSAARYGVRGIPTLALFKDGELKGQLVGNHSREAIEKMIQKHLNGRFPLTLEKVLDTGTE